MSEMSDWISKEMNRGFFILTGGMGRDARIKMEREIVDGKIDSAERRLSKALEYEHCGGRGDSGINYGSVEENTENVRKVREEGRKAMKKAMNAPSSQFERDVDAGKHKTKRKLKWLS